MPITVTNQQNQVAQSLGIQTPAEQQRTPQTNLGQDDFLRLLTEQLQNQDPLNPQSDTDFIASMSSFSSVEAMGDLSNNFELFMNDQADLNSATLEAMINLSAAMENNESMTAQLAGQAYIGKQVTLTDSNDQEITGVVDSIEIVERRNLDGTNDRFVGLVINDEIYPLSSVTAVSENNGVVSTVSSVLGTVANVASGGLL
jgi:flagellar hook assembly protein FlgD